MRKEHRPLIIKVVWPGRAVTVKMDGGKRSIKKKRDRVRDTKRKQTGHHLSRPFISAQFSLKVAMLFFHWCRQEGGKDNDGAEKGGEEDGEDLSNVKRTRKRRSGASEFLIRVAASSHLATGYTMAAVALVTAWSLSDITGSVMRRAGRETGRQME